jgi:hypothetical protein
MIARRMMTAGRMPAGGMRMGKGSRTNCMRRYSSGYGRRLLA